MNGMDDAHARHSVAIMTAAWMALLLLLLLRPPHTHTPTTTLGELANSIDAGAPSDV